LVRSKAEFCASAVEAQVESGADCRRAPCPKNEVVSRFVGAIVSIPFFTWYFASGGAKVYYSQTP